MTRQKLSGMQIIGLLMLIAGLLLLVGGGTYLVKKSQKNASGVNSAVESSLEDIQPDTEASPEETARNNISMAMPVTVFGGVLVLAGLPCFYLPRTESARRRRKRLEEEANEDLEELLIEEELGYPIKDDLDFILDDDIRERLIKERAEMIREKQKRLKKLKKKRRV